MEVKKRFSSHMRERYYDLMINCKFNTLYYQKYMIMPARVDLSISCVSTVLSTVGVISVIEDFIPLWGTAALLLSGQILAIIRPYLPYAQRISSSNFMSIEYQDLYRRLESDWFRYLHSSSNADTPEMETLLSAYQVCYDRIEERFGSGLTFPLNKKSYDEAEEEMNLYFETHIINKGVEANV